MSDEDLNEQALHWLETVANVRVHGTLKEVPLIRFERSVSCWAVGRAPLFGCAAGAFGTRGGGAIDAAGGGGAPQLGGVWAPRGGAGMTSVSRHERISSQLVDLKMPGALEGLDEVIQGVDSGSCGGSEAIEPVAGNPDHAAEQPSSGGGHAFEPAVGGEDADRLAPRAGLPPAERERGVPWSSGGGEDPSGDQPGDPGGGEGPALAPSATTALDRPVRTLPKSPPPTQKVSTFQIPFLSSFRSPLTPTPPRNPSTSNHGTRVPAFHRSRSQTPVALAKR